MAPPISVTDTQEVLLARVVTEIVAVLIKQYQQQLKAKQLNSKNSINIDVRVVKNAVSSKHGLRNTPKLMDIIAAVPDDWRKMLQPFLTAKPIRTASGIAVVAVMCKPHRCPHIAMTGNICVCMCITKLQALLMCFSCDLHWLTLSLLSLFHCCFCWLQIVPAVLTPISSTARRHTQAMSLHRECLDNVTATALHMLFCFY